MRKDALRLAETEEQKIATRKGYRTSAATLRKLAQSPMIFELDSERRGDWDRFQVRKIGFRAQRQKERDFQAVLSLLPDLNRWSDGEKQLLSRIVQARKSPEETTYLKLMRRHERFRSAIIKLGS